MTYDYTTLFAERIRLYGDGRDSDVTVSGAVTLTRDMFYSNLTVNGAGALNTAGYRISVLNTLDLSSAPANAIYNNGNVGYSATGATGAAGGFGAAGNTVPTGLSGNSGGTGNTGAGASGNSSTNPTYGNGGGGGAGGAGGDGYSS